MISNRNVMKKPKTPFINDTNFNELKLSHASIV